MKDSEGREFDGWILKNAGGHYFINSASRTRNEAWQYCAFAKAKGRRLGLRAVKIQIREVPE